MLLLAISPDPKLIPTDGARELWKKKKTVPKIKESAPSVGISSTFSIFIIYWLRLSFKLEAN